MAMIAPQNNPWRLTLFMAASLTCNLLMASLAQATSTEEGQGNLDSTTQTTSETPVTPKKKSETVVPAQEKGSKRFTPSESISEDLSVAFPVDI